MRFCRYVPNSLRNKNPKRHISYLLEKVVFLDPKRLLSPLGRGEKSFFFNFECYDLTNSKEWKVRFDRHVDIEVSYKILWMEVPKFSSLLSKEAVWRQF
jgi:hypothetical protein